MIVGWPERPDRTVNETGDEDFIIGGLALALHESARETSRSIEFFLVINRKRHEVSSFLYLLGRADSGEEHCASHLDDC